MSEQYSAPNFFTLDELRKAEVIPEFKPGDMITFDKGYPEELVDVAMCVEIDLLRDRLENAIRKSSASLAEFGFSFSDLSPSQQELLMPPPLRHLRTDETLIQKRVMHQFKTGIELISAEFIAKRVIPIVTTTARDAFGWELSVTASLKLPGMISHEDGTFPFIVVQDGQALRYGPYNTEKQKIDKVSTRAMRTSASIAKSMAAIALGTGSSGRTIPTRGTLQE